MENKGAEEASLAGVTGLRLSPQELVWHYSESLKSKARAAGDYVMLRTRQGVSLFGEPNIGPIKTIVDRC